MQARLFPAVFALAACLVVVPAAGAGASSGSIGSAGTVAVGQQQFGNTTSGYFNDHPVDFWKLTLTASDRVTIDWESGSGTTGCFSYRFAAHLDVWPSGTTDFSINNVNPAQEFSVGDNGKAESTFTANVTGTYPLMFEAGCSDGGASLGGAYDFTVTVNHTVRLSIPRLSSFRSGSVIPVSAHFPDGVAISDGGLAITVQGLISGRWVALGNGTANNGLANVTARLPLSFKAASIRLRAQAQGTGYVPATTAALTVRIAR